MDIILKYFPNLTNDQIEKFKSLEGFYKEWNEKINVISRKDIDFLYERHILHSLGIAKVIQFAPGTKILDVGCGGGFPGIPLAILFPEVDFFMVDSIGKKITVVNEVAAGAGIKNIRSAHNRAESIKEEFDFVVSRAVTRLSEFTPWVKKKFLKTDKNSLSNGILYLKGGDLTEELAPYKNHPLLMEYELKHYFEEEFFETKKVVYLGMNK